MDNVKTIKAGKPKLKNERKVKTSAHDVYSEYLDGVAFNQAIDLYENITINNNFYNGKQWEGVKAPHLDKLSVNIIKPAVNYYISQIVSDDIATNVTVENEEPQIAKITETIIQNELEATMERTNTSTKNRKLLRNMAIEGDMVLYSYFDNSVRLGAKYNQGAIQTDIVYTTDIIFGNPIEAEIQKQPYILYKQRMLLSEARDLAEKEGADPTEITSDSDEYGTANLGRECNKEYVTIINKFWREDDKVWFTKVTNNAVIKKPVCLDYSLYPFSFASWENMRDCYHGVSPITGVISNQIAINKIYAGAVAYNLSYAFPKILYDRAKLPQGWNNDPTKAIACNGDPTTAIFSTFKPADMSDQVVALINRIIEDTKDSLGVYDAALGNINPNNTSAIVATQKAASAPLDLQKLDFYQMMEDTVRIWLDIMSVDYGIRPVYLTQTVDGQEVSGMKDFDFGGIGNLKYSLKIDIGASTYWSELAQVQTMDNLMNLQILPSKTAYLRAMPNGYIRDREELIEEIKQQEQMQMQMAQQQQQQQMQMIEQQQQLKDEQQSIENANSQADLMKKMTELQTLAKGEDLQYPENQNAGARESGIDSAGVMI